MDFRDSLVLEKWGEGEYQEYRIPGVIVTSQGTILCCYEARMSDNNDWAAIDIILRRSTDGGKTFSRQVIVQNTTGVITTFNNPVLIADGDLVHFIWHQDYASAFYQISRDDGLTFSDPVDITGAFAEFRPRYDWNVIASGPGHGITLSTGRLIVPVWLAMGQPLDDTGRTKAHHPSIAGTIYSDDHGASWHAGGLAEGIRNGNETTAVECADGRVLLNIRNQEPGKYRSICMTSDGVSSFGRPYQDTRLPDPMCFGSTVAAPGFGILFVNCCHNEDRQRINLVLQLSRDDCKSWSDSLLIDPLGGYADLAFQKDQTAYCFYEQTINRNGKGVIDQLVLQEISL